MTDLALSDPSFVSDVVLILGYALGLLLLISVLGVFIQRH